MFRLTNRERTCPTEIRLRLQVASPHTVNCEHQTPRLSLPTPVRDSCVTKKYAVNAVPAKTAQHLFQPVFEFIEIHIVPKLCFERNTGNPWLFRIDFPRVKIEYRRHSVLNVYPVDGPFRIT